MKGMIVAALIVISAIMVGCSDGGSSNSTQQGSAEGEETSQIATQRDVSNTVGMMRSLQLNMLASGLSQSLSTQLGIAVSRSNRVTYPASYEKVRECGVSGTVNTVGEKSNIITYHVNNTFHDCTHINDITVNGTQTVDATYQNNKLVAQMSDNNISVSRGGFAIDLTSDMTLYADRMFESIEIILHETGQLSQSSHAFNAVFHDFNVTMKTTDNTMYLSGLVESDACGVEGYNIETVTPLLAATNGSFTSGELVINGVTYEYHDDETVTATLNNGTTYVLPQGVSVLCELEPF